MRSRTSEQGFTLIELMVVVTIIAVVAALAAPAIGSGLRERNKNLAALDVVRVFRGARALSVGSGAAVLVRFDKASSGSLTVFQGGTNRCNTTMWDSATRRDSYTGSTFDHGSTPRIALTLANVQSDTVDVCFESTGVTYWRSGTTGRMSSNPTFGAASTSDAQGTRGGFQFKISTGSGVDRNVVLPLGSDARLRR